MPYSTEQFVQRRITSSMTRRCFGVLAGSTLLGCGKSSTEQLGLICPLPPDEPTARRTLASARSAGFKRIQVTFSWIDVTDSFLRQLPNWIASEGLEADVLGAYLNCTAPDILIMNTRRQDLDRAIDLAPTLGAKLLTLWTGGYGPKLFSSDPRNWQPSASDAILRTLEPFYKRLEASGVRFALESYITLTCPDAPSLAQLLKRTPPSITAVFDPPNLTPVARYGERDAVLREMFASLRDRVGVVHWKDFRLAADRQSYDLPGPLGGVMNAQLFLELVSHLPPKTPIKVEHIPPDRYASVHARVEPLFLSAQKNRNRA